MELDTIIICNIIIAYFKIESQKTGIPFDTLMSVRLAKYAQYNPDHARNPYAVYYNREMTVSVDRETYEYFQQCAAESNMWFSTYMWLFLSDCAENKIKMPADEE